MFKTMDEDDDNRLDAGELLVMVSAAMETEIGADLQTAKEVLEGARDVQHLPIKQKMFRRLAPFTWLSPASLALATDLAMVGLGCLSAR